jgi:hypothetical protein
MAESRRGGNEATCGGGGPFRAPLPSPLALCKPSGTGVPVSCGLVDLFIDNQNRINHFITETINRARAPWWPFFK